MNYALNRMASLKLRRQQRVVKLSKALSVP